MQLTFETERLLLRPRTLDDLEACLAMDRDPEVTKFVPGPWNDPEKHRAFVLERITADYREGFGYWSVFERTSPDDFLGWILLLHAENDWQDAEIGWRFRREIWGRGYATEAAYAIHDHAFSNVGVASLQAEIDSRNIASAKVAEALGMSFEEERNVILDGVPHRSYMVCASEVF